MDNMEPQNNPDDMIVLKSSSKKVVLYAVAATVGVAVLVGVAVGVTFYILGTQESGKMI